MNLTDIAKILYRRRWIVVLILALTVLGVGATMALATPEYVASSTLLLVEPDVVAPEPSSEPEAPERLNGAVIVEIVEGDSTRAGLDPVQETADYSVRLSDGIFRVEAVSDDPEAVIATASAVLQEIVSVGETFDAADGETTATFEVLSSPSLARERVIVESDGETRTEYFALGSVLLIEDLTVEPVTESPFSDSSGTLRIIEEAVATEATLVAIQEEVGDDQALFEIEFQSRDTAPIMYVSGRATTPDAAVEVRDIVLGLLDEDLADRQAVVGADASTFVTLQRLSLPAEAEDDSGSLRRPVATVTVLGVVAAVSLAVFIDNLLAFRNRVEVTARSRRSTDDGEGDRESGAHLDRVS